MRLLGQPKSAAVTAVLTFPLLAFLLIFSPPAGAQAASASKDAGPQASDALAFLTNVLQSYGHATSYDLESIEERTLSGEFRRYWTKTVTTAIVGPENQYRFEIHDEQANALQVSDGKTEWIYYAPSRQYTQRPAPATGPSRLQPPIGELNGAQRTIKRPGGLQHFIRTAEFAPDETIEVNGRAYACKVIKTEGELPETSPPIKVAFVFWIDKQTRVIRKMIEGREGPLVPDRLDLSYVAETKTVFLVADLTPAFSSEQTFTFAPPPTSSLVEKLDNQFTALANEFVGKPAPDISLKAADGKDISLKSFQGKPVLMDFWATWCAPCVESLPTLEKLYREAVSRGLVLISIDQDVEPAKASEFWTKHCEPWPNFHASNDILGHFPPHGIPYFLLIDATGTVAYSAAGLDETALRAALKKLDPAHARPPAP